MNLSAPSWDLFIALFLVISIGYGFLMQRERIIVTLVAAYMGLAIAQLVWPDVLGFFHGEQPLLGKYFIRANVTESQVKIALFVLGTILISDKGGIDAQHSRGWLSPLELTVVSALTGGFIAAIIIGFLPEANQTLLAEQSRLVGYLVKYHELAIVVPALGLVALGFLKGNRRD